MRYQKSVDIFEESQDFEKVRFFEKSLGFENCRDFQVKSRSQKILKLNSLFFRFVSTFDQILVSFSNFEEHKSRDQKHFTFIFGVKIQSIQNHPNHFP